MVFEPGFNGSTKTKNLRVFTNILLKQNLLISPAGQDLIPRLGSFSDFSFSWFFSSFELVFWWSFSSYWSWKFFVSFRSCSSKSFSFSCHSLQPFVFSSSILVWQLISFVFSSLHIFLHGMMIETWVSFLSFSSWKRYGHEIEIWQQKSWFERLKKPNKTKEVSDKICDRRSKNNRIGMKKRAVKILLYPRRQKKKIPKVLLILFKNFEVSFKITANQVQFLDLGYFRS